jgi:hypothetical protein
MLKAVATLHPASFAVLVLAAGCRSVRQKSGRKKGGGERIGKWRRRRKGRDKKTHTKSVFFSGLCSIHGRSDSDTNLL